MTTKPLTFIGAIDRRTSVGTISALDAHKMAKRSRTKSDISAVDAIAIAASHGLTIAGAKPSLQLLKDGQPVRTFPYALNTYKDIKAYCEQIAVQKRQAELSAKSDRQVCAEAQAAKSFIFS